jgi:hypothetical protein
MSVFDQWVCEFPGKTAHPFLRGCLWSVLLVDFLILLNVFDNVIPGLPRHGGKGVSQQILTSSRRGENSRDGSATTD